MGFDATRRKRSTLIGTMLGALALLFGAAGAHAADACYQDTYGDIVVFKNFRMPRAGDCKPLTGHQHNSWITLDGTICGSSDGTDVALNFTYLSNAQLFGTVHYLISRDTNRGNAHACDGRTDGGVWGCSYSTAWKIDCPRPTHYGR
jgi:hypothetical protein